MKRTNIAFIVGGIIVTIGACFLQGGLDFIGGTLMAVGSFTMIMSPVL